MFEEGGEHTAVDNVVVVEVGNGLKHLPNNLRRILLGELSLLANPIEKLASLAELGDDIILVLPSSAPSSRQTQPNSPCSQTNPQKTRYADALISGANPAHRKPSAHCP